MFMTLYTIFSRLLRECGICFERMKGTLVFECTACQASFCANCMHMYIQSKVQDGLVSSQYLICPATDCAHALSEGLIEAFTDSATFLKYKTFLKNQTFGIRFCPREGCGVALEEPLHSRQRRVTCSSCHQESCMRCGGEFHRIPICRSVESQLRKWKKQQRKIMRLCPRCRVTIEKNGGCQHMTCTHCQHHFCWLCMRPWETHGSRC